MQEHGVPEKGGAGPPGEEGTPSPASRRAEEMNYKSGVPAGHGKVIVSLFVVSNVTHWYSTGIWAGLEGPKWLHSHVYCLGGECWKVGLSQDSRSEPP